MILCAPAHGACLRLPQPGEVVKPIARTWCRAVSAAQRIRRIFDNCPEHPRAHRAVLNPAEGASPPTFARPRNNRRDRRMALARDLPIDTSATAADMADAMFGAGITVQSASYMGGSAASGIYSDGDTAAPGATPSDTGVILSTGRAESYTNESGDANQS